MIEYSSLEFSEARFNLALEEALLEDFLTEERQALVRIWSNDEISAVLGRGEKADQQLNLETCQKNHIPVLRRVSGGGTVLHGPGNLNLSFFLPWSFHPDLKNLPASYSLILGWVRRAIYEVTGVEPFLKGTCDLCLGEKKVSGTAQARKRYGLLHHLTLLVDFDLTQLSLLLKEPEKQPDYRQHREHLDFVTTFKKEGLSLPRNPFVDALQDVMGPFDKTATLPEKTLTRCNDLVKHKYTNDLWNLFGKIPAS